MKIIDKNTVELTAEEQCARNDFEDLLDRGMSIPQALGATINLNPTVFEFPSNEPFANWLMGPLDPDESYDPEMADAANNHGQ